MLRTPTPTRRTIYQLYHTLDELEELSANIPDIVGGDGAWKYMPSLAAITPNAVTSGAGAVSTAVGRSVGVGMGGYALFGQWAWMLCELQGDYNVMRPITIVKEAYDHSKRGL